MVWGGFFYFLNLLVSSEEEALVFTLLSLEPVKAVHAGSNGGTAIRAVFWVLLTNSGMLL